MENIEKNRENRTRRGPECCYCSHQSCSRAILSTHNLYDILLYHRFVGRQIELSSPALLLTRRTMRGPSSVPDAPHVRRRRPVNRNITCVFHHDLTLLCILHVCTHCAGHRCFLIYKLAKDSTAACTDTGPLSLSHDEGTGEVSMSMMVPSKSTPRAVVR